MSILKKSKKVFRYCLIGGMAAVVHALVLLVLSKSFPLWISNLSGFLVASLISYLGHAIYTFRRETKGKRFARRWLILQFSTNIILASLLPLLFSSIKMLGFSALIFILTPTLVNALIWNFAAKFSLRRNHLLKYPPILHADDLGLTSSTNNAIISLAKEGKIASASLLVNGTAVNEAIQLWEENKSIELVLHLCLTEGPALASNSDTKGLTNGQGSLKVSFTKLLILSFIPRVLGIRKRYEDALYQEINSQINQFKFLTSINQICIDGHQHIHLIPIVLDILIKLSEAKKITWIRTTYEPLPTGLSWHYWRKIFFNGGLIKWFMLQWLTIIAKPKISKAKIRTNAGFSGILFTGSMSEEPLRLGFKELQILKIKPGETQSLILSHPSDQIIKEEIFRLSRFPLSKRFFSSKWRKIELDALRRFKSKNTKIIYPDE